MELLISSGACPLCLNSAEVKTFAVEPEKVDLAGNYELAFDCQKCGTYSIGELLFEKLSSIQTLERERALLSAAVRWATDTGRPHPRFLCVCDFQYLLGAYEQLASWNAA